MMHWIWNPHKAPMGLGNYDVNVLTLALQQKGGDDDDDDDTTLEIAHESRRWAENQVFVDADARIRDAVDRQAHPSG